MLLAAGVGCCLDLILQKNSYVKGEREMNANLMLRMLTEKSLKKQKGPLPMFHRLRESIW